MGKAISSAAASWRSTRTRRSRRCWTAADRTDPRLRIRLDPAVSGGEVRSFSRKDIAPRIETLNWLFWQMGSAPYLGGGFGHFYAYAPIKIEYAIDRFAMEVKRHSTYWIAVWPRASTSLKPSTRSPTSRCSPGTAASSKGGSTGRRSSCRCKLEERPALG